MTESHGNQVGRGGLGVLYRRSMQPAVRRNLALLLTLAGALLFVLSLNRTWWGMIMYAPQYPDGLETLATLRSMEGDVGEIDTLNHYIGMMKLEEAAALERMAAPYLVWLFALLSVVGVVVRHPFLAWLVRLPLVLFPVVFLADLKFWLWYAGNHLDRKAPLSATIKGFTPTMLGEGKIAQFRTIGWLEPGFWLAVAGASCVVAGGLLLLQRSSAEGEV